MTYARTQTPSTPESSAPSAAEFLAAWAVVGRALAAIVAPDSAPGGVEPIGHYTGATWPFGSPRSMRAAIKAGRVPAVKVGRELRVPRVDADAVYAAKIRPATKRPLRVSEHARMRRQLEASGIRIDATN